MVAVSMWLLSACNNYEVLVAGTGSKLQTPLAADGSCTNQTGGKLSITVPGPGKIMVTAQAMMGLKSHTTGEIDMMMLHLGGTPTDCTFDSAGEGFNQMGISIPKDEPSWTASVVRLIPIAVSRTFTVNAAGEYTYYLNGRRVGGSGAGYIWESAMQAVYYPGR